MRTRSEPAAHLVLLGTLTLVAAGLRFYRLDSPLWYDEIVTLIESVRAPLLVIVTRFGGDNNHPLYSVLAHLCVSAFGEQPWALRLPAALFGVAAIPLIYVLGRAVADHVEAAAAAVILTVSYHHVWFSQNARGYTAVLFLVLLSTYALVRWLDDRRRSFLVLYAVATALGAYAHMTTVLVSGGQALALAIVAVADPKATRLRTDWKPAAMGFIGAAALTVLAYAPMLADVGSVMSGAGDTSGGDKAALSWAIGAVLQGLQIGFGTLWAIALGGAVVAAGVFSYVRQRPAVALLFVVPVLLTVVMALALHRPLRPRFMFFAAGFAVLLVVRGAATLGGIAGRVGSARAPQRIATAAVVLLTIGIVALSARSLPYGYRYPKQDYVEAATFVEAAMAAGDRVAVVADGAEIPMVRYLGRPWQRVDSSAELNALRHGAARVWVISTFPSYIEDGQPQLWRILQTECVRVDEVEGTVEDGTITVHRCP